MAYVHWATNVLQKKIQYYRFIFNEFFYIKIFYSSNYLLKFVNMKLESRVIVCQLNTVNGFWILHTPPVAF